MKSVFERPIRSGATTAGTLAGPAARAKAAKHRGYPGLARQPSEQP